MPKREIPCEDDETEIPQELTNNINKVSLKPLASFANDGATLSPRKRTKLSPNTARADETPIMLESTSKTIQRRSSRLKASPRVQLDTNDASEEEAKPRNAKSSSPKKPRVPKGYAPPEKYAHLRELQDVIDENLDILFCGINPGRKSAEIGHHFGHPSNQFWYCLHQSGLTSRQLSPTEEFDLPALARLGITDLVDRPTSEESELSVQDKIDGIPTLLAKVAKYRPHVLCFVSLGNAQIVQTQINKRYKTAGVKAVKSGLGLQRYKMVHSDSEEAANGAKETLFYAVPSTSGLVRVPQREGKVTIFKELHDVLRRQKSGELDTTDLRVISPY